MWKVKAEIVVRSVASSDGIPRGSGWIKSEINSNNYHQVIITLGKQSRAWFDEWAELEIKTHRLAG